MQLPIQLFTNQTANAATTAKIVSRGQRFTLAASGTWDTASLKVEVSPDEGTTWVDTADNTALTDDGSVTFLVAEGFHVRLDLSSVGAGTDINAWLGFCRT